MYDHENDQLLQTVIDINLLLEQLAFDLDYQSLKDLKDQLIRGRDNNARLRNQFINLSRRVRSGCQLLAEFQGVLSNIWEEIHGGRLNDSLECEVRTRPVRRSNRGFLLLD